MGKTFIRIDDRLIHGQIMTAWCNYLDIGEIIGVDDKTANNPMLKQIMTMSVPKKYNCKVVTIEEAKNLIENESNLNRLFIFRFPFMIENFIDKTDKIEFIILGNIAKQTDSIYNESSGTSIFYLTQKDVDVLDNFHNNGMEIFFKALPDSSDKSWKSFKH